MKKKNILMICIVFFLIFAGWIMWQNQALGITEYEMNCSPHYGLSGFTMVQISDLHNAKFGENQQRLLEKVAECSPDMIAITGDLLDCRHPDVETAMDFIEGAVEIAPVYYVPGNHERWVFEEYQKLCRRMEAAGVHLLINRMEEIPYGEERILCMGIEDPDFYDTADAGAEKEMTRRSISQFRYGEEEFTLLLSHRPELFDIYVEKMLDVVLTGHAHGGQFRLPLIGGLVAPNQGFFPKYDGGMFVEGDTHMLVSRGIGNSIIPIRFYNPPEIVVVKLGIR